MSTQTQPAITPKIITPTGYIKRGFTGEKKIIVNAHKYTAKSSRQEGEIMREKMMLELCNLLKTEKIECRADAYEIMKELGFLPIVAKEREMGLLDLKSITRKRENYLA